MVMIFTSESQNSTSPNARTEMMFVPTKMPMRISDQAHDGTAGNQLAIVSPPSTASYARTPTQKYQYSHPTR